MATSTSENVAKPATIFDCPICLEELKSPRYIPCKHTYCETCLKTYIESTVVSAETGDSTFCCPVCRESFPVPKPKTSLGRWVSEFPKNQIISTMMKSNGSKNKITYSCDPCDRFGDDVKASHWCSNCSELLCDFCLKNFHKRMKDADQHQVSDLSGILFLPECKEGLVQREVNLEPCTIHKDRFYEAFCFEHSQLCCVSCLVYNHPNCSHKATLDVLTSAFAEGSQVQFTGDSLRRISELLLKIIEKRETQKTELEEKASNMLSTVEGDINRVIKKLEDLKSQIKVDFSAVCESMMQPIKKQITVVKALHDSNAEVKEKLAIALQKIGARSNFINLLKTQNSFERYKTDLKALSSEDDMSINFEISLSKPIMEIKHEKGRCYEIKKSSFMNWKDSTKRELSESVDKLSEYFVSMAKSSLEQRKDDTVIADTDRDGSKFIENNPLDQLSSECDDVDDGSRQFHGINVMRKMTKSESNRKKREEKRKRKERRLHNVRTVNNIADV